ncbi:MAG: DUF4297 domain-containing protein [Candidatus Babeliaceae bacterium]|nr:DUF4297 domain-containing protein [Candidatus Babeliaceae bacterium]
MTTFETHHSPLEVEPENTSGEDTELFYHYQHAYGTILLIAAAYGNLPYISIYAEHHEDLLCERSDELVDAYQIKTRDPDLGVWDSNDDAVKKSIKRFVQLNNGFPEFMCSFNFVSNVGYSNPGYEIQDKTRLRRSPIKFLEVAKRCSRFEDIAEPFAETFRELLGYCGCSPEELFSTLHKVELIDGPDRDGFDSIITEKYLPALSECSSYSVSVLNAIRDEITHKVWLASHIINDPSKYWYPIGKVSFDNPRITAKRVPVDIVLQTVRDKAEPPLRFYGESTIQLGSGKGNLWKLQKKMRRGDLNSQIPTMEHRSIAAESKLMEYAHKKPGEIEAYLTQLEGVVQGECDEAYLHAGLSGKINGPQMLDDVYNRLRQKAELHCDLVLRQPYELLIGVAGLLSGECTVWWSEHFDLEGAE